MIGIDRERGRVDGGVVHVGRQREADKVLADLVGVARVLAEQHLVVVGGVRAGEAFPVVGRVHRVDEGVLHAGRAADVDRGVDVHRIHRAREPGGIDADPEQSRGPSRYERVGDAHRHLTAAAPIIGRRVGGVGMRHRGHSVAGLVEEVDRAVRRGDRCQPRRVQGKSERRGGRLRGKGQEGAKARRAGHNLQIHARQQARDVRAARCARGAGIRPARLGAGSERQADHALARVNTYEARSIVGGSNLDWGRRLCGSDAAVAARHQSEGQIDRREGGPGRRLVVDRVGAYVGGERAVVVVVSVAVGRAQRRDLGRGLLGHGGLESLPTGSLGGRRLNLGMVRLSSGRGQDDRSYVERHGNEHQAGGCAQATTEQTTAKQTRA